MYLSSDKYSRLADDSCIILFFFITKEYLSGTQKKEEFRLGLAETEGGGREFDGCDWKNHGSLLFDGSSSY